MGNSVARPRHNPAKPSESGSLERVSDMCVLPRDVLCFLYRGFLLN
jgi:hypothetical protein